MTGRKTLPQEIRESLVRLIDDGRLQPGEQLPSERELCQSFGVARTSVREALQGLICLGKADRRGNRVVVSDGPNGSEHPNPLRARIHELFEVRRLIEVPIAELAAHRATDAQRREVATTATAFSDDMTFAEFRACDNAFHEAVAEACGNQILTDLYDKVLASLFRSEDFGFLLDRPDAGPMRQIIKLSCRDHRRIADAMDTRDIPAVAAAVVRHLDMVQARLIKEVDDGSKGA